MSIKGLSKISKFVTLTVHFLIFMLLFIMKKLSYFLYNVICCTILQLYLLWPYETTKNRSKYILKPNWFLDKLRLVPTPILTWSLTWCGQLINVELNKIN